jgi:hypothetical protein
MSYYKQMIQLSQMKPICFFTVDIFAQQSIRFLITDLKKIIHVEKTTKTLS